MNTTTAPTPNALEQFDKFVRKTRVGATNTHKLIYPALGIAGEGGEFADKVKKHLRGDYLLDAQHARDMALELGDVLWYVTAAAHDLGFVLGDIIDMNRAKILSRRKRGTLKGNGDHR